MPEGSIGSGSYVGISEESVRGTGVAPSTFLEFTSESLKTSNQTISSKAVTASRSRKKVFMGPYKAGGDIAVEVGPENFGKVLKAALGRVQSTGPDGDGAYTHIFDTRSPEQTIGTTTAVGSTTTTVDTARTEIDDYWNDAYISCISGDAAGETVKITDFDAATDTITHDAFSTAIGSGGSYVILRKLPSLTVEVFKQIMVQRFLGCKVEALKLNCSAGNIVSAAATVRAMKDDIDIVASTPSFSTKDPFLYHGGEVKIGGVASGYVPKVDISIASALSNAVQVIGSRFDTEPLSQTVIVNGNFDIKLISQAAYQQFLGGSGITEPGDSQTSTTLELILTGALIGGSIYDKLNILIPQIYYDTADANIGGVDEIVQNVTFEAVYKDTTDYELKATLINEVVSY